MRVCRCRSHSDRSYSLEVNEDIFGAAPLSTKAASSKNHLVVDVVEADSSTARACRLKTHLAHTRSAHTCLCKHRSYLLIGASVQPRTSCHSAPWHHPNPKKNDTWSRNKDLTSCNPGENHQVILKGVASAFTCYIREELWEQLLPDIHSWGLQRCVCSVHVCTVRESHFMKAVW